MRLDSPSRRRLAVLVGLLALSGFVVALLAARVVYTGSFAYGNLVWNLFLAWIPFTLAIAVYDGARRGARRSALIAGGALWLLFFPNAPYIVTDLQHLRWWDEAPIWFDVVLVSTAAWTGLVLGFVSLYLVQAVVGRAVGAVNAWALALVVLALSSYGIYLGRFERWNSWDVFGRPRLLFESVRESLVDPSARPVAVTILFTAFLTLTYAVFYSVVRLGMSEGRAERP
jgi:uncharacterized membrane protein